MGLFGGKKVTIPATGFYSQPQAYQDLYTGLLSGANSTLLPGGQFNYNMFKPTPITEGERAGLASMAQGFTPNQESLQSDLSMLMNPFDEYVINDLNRQSQGQNSLVKQFGNQAGQMGSNRNFLGTSDVEQNRLNSIGGFRQSQYNNSLNTIFNNLVPSRRADATGQLTGGAYGRELQAQQDQAPFNALMQAYGLFNGIPTEFGNFGTKQQTIKTGGGLGGILGGLGQIASLAGGPLGGIGGSIFSSLGGNALGQAIGGLFSSSPMGPYQPFGGFFSDRELKQDIEFIGLENGHKIYKFAYKSQPEKHYIGVMADEVEELTPNAVKEIDGYKAVNYDMIGVNFREAA